MAARVSRETAFHEAGHAVAVLLCGEWLYDILVPDDEGKMVNRKGYVISNANAVCQSSMEHWPPALVEPDARHPHLEKTLRARAANLVFLSFAGFYAEMKLEQDDPFGFELLFTLSAEDEGGDFQHAEQALAPFLFTSTARHGCMKRIWNTGHRFIAEPPGWSAVERIAAAILRGVLDGDELQAIGRAELPEAPRRPVEHAVIGRVPGLWPKWRTKERP